MDSKLVVYGYCICDDKWKTSFYNSIHHTIYYCISGTVYYVMNERRYYLKKNTYYIFPMFFECEFYHNVEDPFEVMWFQLDVFPRMEHKVSIVEANTIYLQKITNVLLLSIDRGKQIVEPLIQSFLQVCLQDKVFLLNNNEKMSLVLNYISEHINEKITNEILSDLLAYNTKYFIRIFEDNIGITPHRYIKLCRLDLARSWLMEGKSVKETADLCGYTSPDALSRDIKNIYGITASSFKLLDNNIPFI